MVYSYKLTLEEFERFRKKNFKFKVLKEILASRFNTKTSNINNVENYGTRYCSFSMNDELEKKALIKILRRRDNA